MLFNRSTKTEDENKAKSIMAICASSRQRGSSIIAQNLIPLISQSFLAVANLRGGLGPPGGGGV